MEVRELKNVEVKYFSVLKKDFRGLDEQDCFNYYKRLGYTVYSRYNHSVIRANFNRSVVNLFNKYNDGYPDLLLKKDDIWEFVEVKTTNDSLRPNQAVFLEKLSEHVKTSVHLFIDTEDLLNPRKIRKDRGNRINYNHTSFTTEAKRLVDYQKKKGHKEYYIVAKLYKSFPGFQNNPRLVSIVTSFTSLTSDNIKWFINTRKEELSKDAVTKISRKKKITKGEALALTEHKKYI